MALRLSRLIIIETCFRLKNASCVLITDRRSYSNLVDISALVRVSWDGGKSYCNHLFSSVLNVISFQPV